MIRTDAENIFFLSSSGHCPLDCHYCIVEPIAKHQPSLTLDDILYLLDSVTGKSALLFSGAGDFFAGYHKNDRLLEGLLERDVDIALDINGVMIHEFGQIPDDKIVKVRHLNLTMHYRQLVEKNALPHWASNARTLMEHSRCTTFLMNTIVSPADQDRWDEMLDFYRDQVFRHNGRQIALIKDHLNWDPAFEPALKAFETRHADIIAETRHVDFSPPFEGIRTVFCPAGVSYFRVWNDGHVQGCPFVEEVAALGNLKERSFSPRTELVHCVTPYECDCSHIMRLGKMRPA